MPAIRGMISRRRAQGRPFRRFSRRAGIRRLEGPRALAALGTSCPDHFLRTKIRPLVIDFDPAKPDVDAVIAGLADGARGLPRGLRRLLRALQACRQPGHARSQRGRLPGARRRHDHLRQATRRPRASPANSTSTPSTSCAAPRPFRPMSACPSRKPSTSNTGCSRKPSCSACRSRRALAGKIALVTGGAGGIGKATARAPAAAKAPASCWPTSTRRRSAAPMTNSAKAYGKDVVRAVRLDVTDEAAVDRRLCRAALEFGGLDILVSNAGIASSAPIEETTLAMWNRNMDILATGYFLVSREAFRLMKRAEDRRQRRLHRLQERPGRLAQRRRLLHGQGGRNPPRPLPGAGGRGGAIRVNVGQSGRRAARLEDLDRRVDASSAPPPTRCRPDELEEHYRQRSMLKLASSRRTSPRRSTSSPPTCRPNRPATSSMSMRATRRAFTR